jgi:uncharacterized membrane protein YhaH (DUF805 family)
LTFAVSGILVYTPKQENLMSWFLLAWQRATDFSGRSRRKEYWYFQLFNAIVVIFLGLFAIAFSDQGKPAMVPFDLMMAYGLILFVPSLAVTIRRLHDIGKSGWWYLIAFVPLIGGIILFVFTLLDSEPFANPWGLDPKASERVIIAPPYSMPR